MPWQLRHLCGSDLQGFGQRFRLSLMKGSENGLAGSWEELLVEVLVVRVEGLKPKRKAPVCIRPGFRGTLNRVCRVLGLRVWGLAVGWVSGA